MAILRPPSQQLNEHRSNRPVSNFESDLAFSNDDKHEPFWDAVYRREFPTLVWHTKNDNNNTSQRLGIDRIIYLGCNRFIYADEKLDTWPRRNFFLEYQHVYHQGNRVEPGWIVKDLAIDYLAYAFVNERFCDFLPWNGLSRAWQMKSTVWLKFYPTKERQNRHYKTMGCIVPVDVVWTAITEAMCIQLDTK